MIYFTKKPHCFGAMRMKLALKRRIRIKRRSGAQKKRQHNVHAGEEYQELKVKLQAAHVKRFLLQIFVNAISRPFATYTG